MEDFIRKKITEDLKDDKSLVVRTRFPPEPNGYLHIGHAKSIMLNFSIASEFNGACNLRFDDTNPEKEDVQYVDSIKKDILWLGFDWGLANETKIYFTSDYFEKLYQFATILIKKGLAYVDHCSVQHMKELRGTLTKAGVNSPYRDRSVDENLHWFEKMKLGQCEEGQCLLRAKIDMAHSNLVMRDPAIYRIKKLPHHRTKNVWCIYPMYDFAHSLSDVIENISHSLCTLEFEIHRPLYDWFIRALDLPKPIPQQIEFARLELTYTVMSKRILKYLVDENIVSAWDDPRLPTISGMRRRGYTACAIKNFCKSVGVTKVHARLEIQKLEEALRDDLNKTAHRIMVVENPVKLIITNYPDNKQDFFEAENLPDNKDAGARRLMFSKIIYIEKDDFLEDPPKKYFRLSPGKEVRLKYAYYVTCTNVIKDTQGEVTEIHAIYDDKSRGGWSGDGRKVKGTLHWVSEADAQDIVIQKYGRLFSHVQPDVQNIKASLADNSFVVHRGAKAESYIKEIVKQAQTNASKDVCITLQFLRKGYYAYDKISSLRSKEIVFNSTVSLKDSFNKK